MDNNAREQEALNTEDQELALLEEQLREAQAAEDFFNQASGKIWVKIVTLEISKLVRDVTSDKFLKDHTGYVNAIAELSANRNVLRKMQVAGSYQRKAKLAEKIEEKNG